MIKRTYCSCAILLLLLSVNRTEAHPHVWVTFHSDVLYAADGTMTGIRHAWTFDEMFSAYALQGTSHAKKGQYTRQELASLAQTNVDSLKEYDYFTYARADDGKKLKFGDAVDYWLDYKKAALTLHFTLPLKAPASAKAIKIEVYDPSIFVDFEFAKDGPVSLSGAPQCVVSYDLPHQPTPAEQARLSQLDAVPLDASSTYGEIFANKILVKCP